MHEALYPYKICLLASTINIDKAGPRPEEIWPYSRAKRVGTNILNLNLCFWARITTIVLTYPKQVPQTMIGYQM